MYYIKGKNFRAESRLLVFFFYFAFAAALSLIFFTIGSQRIDKDRQHFASYFACEALGNDADSPCTFDVNREQQQAFNIASLVGYTMGPSMAMVYVIPLDKVKKKLESLKTLSVNVNISTS